MTIRRIPETQDQIRFYDPCRHAEHNPPTHMALQPGLYEHTCPGCGKVIRFRVHGATW